MAASVFYRRFQGVQKTPFMCLGAKALRHHLCTYIQYKNSKCLWTRLIRFPGFYYPNILNPKEKDKETAWYRNQKMIEAASSEFAFQNYYFYGLVFQRNQKSMFFQETNKLRALRTCSSRWLTQIEVIWSRSIYIMYGWMSGVYFVSGRSCNMNNEFTNT